MTNITGYSQNGRYLYQYNNPFASGANEASESSDMVMISYASGSSGASNVSGTSAASDASGVSGSSNVSSIYTLSYLKDNMKFTNEIIQQYFDKTKDGKYVLKADSKYKTASELRNALIEDCQTKLIIDNFLNNRNRETDSSAEMKQIFNGETELYESVTKDNYISIIDSLSYTPEKLQEFKKAALEKFVKDFSVGNKDCNKNRHNSKRPEASSCNNYSDNKSKKDEINNSSYSTFLRPRRTFRFLYNFFFKVLSVENEDEDNQ